MNIDDEREKIERVFLETNDRGYKGLVAMSSKDGTKFYSQSDPKTVHDIMMQVARRLAWLPASLSEVVEGHHVVKSGGDADEISSRIFMELEESCQSIAIVLDEDGDEGDSVFCVGEPSTLCYLALRTCLSIEQAHQQTFNEGLN